MKYILITLLMVISFSSFGYTSRFLLFLNTSPSKAVYVEITDDLETTEDVITFKIDVKSLISSVLEPRVDAKQIAEFVISRYGSQIIPEDGIIAFQAQFDEFAEPDYLFKTYRAKLIENLSPVILKMGVDVSTFPADSKLATSHRDLEILRQQIEKQSWM